MQLEKIISLANEPMRLQFLVMERSLRATGSTLPIHVIPYDQRRFELPKNAIWWEMGEVTDWLEREGVSPRMRKFQCFLVQNYQFADPDIVFLKDPSNVMVPHEGFVATDTEWNKPQYTYSDESLRILANASSTWQAKIFNSGQFACGETLYDFEALKAVATDARYAGTCLRFPVHDQPSINLLVHLTKINITNLTLPPISMQSTWAGDYLGEFEHLWSDPDRKPYLIHWAGPILDLDRPINQLFYSYLTGAERAEWEEQQRIKRSRELARYRAKLSQVGRAVHDLKQLIKPIIRGGRRVPATGRLPGEARG